MKILSFLCLIIVSSCLSNKIDKAYYNSLELDNPNNYITCIENPNGCYCLEFLDYSLRPTRKISKARFYGFDCGNKKHNYFDGNFFIIKYYGDYKLVHNDNDTLKRESTKLELLTGKYTFINKDNYKVYDYFLEEGLPVNLITYYIPSGKKYEEIIFENNYKEYTYSKFIKVFDEKGEIIHEAREVRINGKTKIIEYKKKKTYE